MRSRFPFAIGPALLLGSCLGLAGCRSTSEQAPGKGPPTVPVSLPLQREVTDYQDYTARTAAVDSVQVQARVTGYLDKIHFKEGDDVQEGTVLYEIDPRPYKDAFDQAKANLDQAKANLAVAKANAGLAKATLEVDLKAGKGVTELQLDQDRASVQSNNAQVEAAQAAIEVNQAALETAQLNLGWTKVTAPVTGVVSRLLVTRGNLIVANQTTLTSIVAQDPMWVYFDADEPTVLQVEELIRQGKLKSVRAEGAKIPIRLQLVNEKGFPHEAILDFVNNQLDQATATLLIRAVFPNPQPAHNVPRLFAPNMFVRVRVSTSSPYQGLLVSPEAVGTDQDLKYLYVVDEDNKVVRHNVKLGSIHDGLQVVTEGLKPGERVLVSGLQRVQQGATVNPNLVPMPTPMQGSLPANPPPVLKAPIPPSKK
ncbi:MAG: efflux RND transporter periplasmic adaptor subunit [Planctomycetes bacterium]|nr:efflux RND transporter periplasmic adaptor subunit [Planctomycetota bacterium]